MDKLKLHTPDLTAANVERIAALFPNCVTEAADEKGNIRRAIDFDLLKQELSADLVEGPQERYRLDWPGKREALALANTPVALTLRPCREESVDFENTQNLYIEGDNLDALKLLQETYLGKVKMIYIDPPYNTGNDFIYEDDFTAEKEAYQRGAGEKDEEGNRMMDEERWRQNTTSNGRFHSDWLSMIYPRLKLARNLMREDGVIFISVGDHEVANLRRVCDEIFGGQNFISTVSRLMKSGGAKGSFFTLNIDFILVYAYSTENVIPFKTRIADRQIETYYNKVQAEGIRKGERYGEERLFKASLDSMRGCKNQRYWIRCPDGSHAIPPGANFPAVVGEGEKIEPTAEDKVWKWTYSRYSLEFGLGNIVFKETNTSGLVDENGKQSRWNIYNKLWLSEQQEKGKLPSNFIGDMENRMSSAELEELKIPFDFAKPSKLIGHLLEIAQVSHGDVILDFFSGSGTTAHAVMQFNADDGGRRRHIMVQLPEPCDEKSEAFKAGYKTIAEIGKERIRRSGRKVLDEWQAKHAKDNPAQGDLLEPSFPGSAPPSSPDIGFRVLKIDSSNFADIQRTPDELDQTELALHTEHIKPERTPEDLLFQVLVDWGVDLALPITAETLAGKQVFFVDENALAACFDSGLTEETIKAIAARNPLRAVFRDEGYGDDSTRINVEQLFKLLSPGTELKSL